MTDNSLKDDQNKLDQLAKSWSRLINCINHDLTTPLAIIRMGSLNLDKILTTLCDEYQLAVKHNLLQTSQAEQKNTQDAFQYLILSIQENANKMQEFLNLLHPYTKQLLSTSDETILLSAKATVQKAIQAYPFANDNERSLIHIDFPCDFTFHCAPIFIDSLLDNLFHNAFRAIQEAKKGQITIWTEETENGYILHFKDSALGMGEDKLTHLFQRFFSKRNHNIIPGLGFCRLALLQRGGNILCQSIVGEYTDFSIQFKK